MPEQTWKPHPRQTMFLSIPDTVFEGLYGGAAGGGKSETLLMLPIARGFYKHPRFKGIIFRRTYPELESEMIVRSHFFYPSCGATYNADKRRWIFPSKAIMQFGHVEFEQDVRKYDTAEYNYMAFDELTSFTRGQYIYLAMSRCRSASRDLPAIVRSGTNPGNVGHSWVRDRFVEPAPAQTIIRDKNTGLKRIFIPCLAKDNPHIDPDYVNRLMGLPEADRRAKLDGDWWTFSGQVFDDWREEHFQDEPPNAQHVIDPFEIPAWWPRILSIDWGYAAMVCALWGALSPDGRLYVYREYTCTKTKISTWATEVGQLSENQEFIDIILCRSAWSDSGTNLTIEQEFKRYSGLSARSADNTKGTRIATKLLVQEYLRWSPKPKLIVPATGYSQEEANMILRKLGSDALLEYEKRFKGEEDETNLPKLQVFSTCTALRKCIPLCVYDKNIKEDVEEFNGDDPYDALRYMVKAVAERRIRLVEEDVYQRKIADVLSEYARTKDYNRFQKRMEYVEARRPKAKPIRRYHY